MKEFLLNKDKIDTELMGESRHDDSRQVHYSREKSNNESSTSNSKHKNLTYNYYHKKGHIRSKCWIQNKKQPMLMSLNWLEEMKNSATFYLLQIDQLITKIDGSYI